MQASETEKHKAPLKITWEIYSGRVSPYFEITSEQERHEIEIRLQKLPAASNEDSDWNGAYIFELPTQHAKGTRTISVCPSQIHITEGTQKYSYLDKKDLRKYLDALKANHKLVSGDRLNVTGAN